MLPFTLYTKYSTLCTENKNYNCTSAGCYSCSFKYLYELIDQMSSIGLFSPVEVDHSFGPLLMTCGLCTVPNHGEHCSTGAVRRRRAGEAKGLSRSGVNGAVRGVRGVPTTERAKTEAGVFISKVGLGLIRSSVPEVTIKKKRLD